MEGCSSALWVVFKQHILNDERFHSNLETEEHEKWMAVQVLDTLIVGPHLSEDALVDIIKVIICSRQLNVKNLPVLFFAVSFFMTEFINDSR